MQIALQERDYLSALPQVVHLTLALAEQTLVEQPSGHPWQGRFASRIDIEQHQRISIAEGRIEFLQQQVRTRVAMRLKDHHQACLRPDCLGSPQRLTNLFGMVAIIVHDCNTVAYPTPVKASLHATKLFQSLGNGR